MLPLLAHGSAANLPQDRPSLVVSAMLAVDPRLDLGTLSRGASEGALGRLEVASTMKVQATPSFERRAAGIAARAESAQPVTLVLLAGLNRCVPENLVLGMWKLAGMDVDGNRAVLRVLAADDEMWVMRRHFLGRRLCTSDGRDVLPRRPYWWWPRRRATCSETLRVWPR